LHRLHQYDPLLGNRSNDVEGIMMNKMNLFYAVAVGVFLGNFTIKTFETGSTVEGLWVGSIAAILTVFFGKVAIKLRIV
jgi:hypothetical protein